MAPRRKKVSMLLIGSGELKNKLRDLTTPESKRAIQGAVKEALKPMHRAAQAGAPKATGRLRRSIRVRAIKRSRKRIGVRVTTNSSDNLYKGNTFYGAFQEFGWKTGKRGSKNRKQIDGKHFMERAADQTLEETMAIFNQRIDAHITKVIGKRK